jgi:hypothetical protein
MANRGTARPIGPTAVLLAVASAAVVARAATPAPRTTRVSVDSSGTQAGGASALPALPSNGRFVAFWSRASKLVPDDTNGEADAFVHDLRTGVTPRVTLGSDGAQATGGTSHGPSVSANGALVAFTSFATNLVPGDTNGTSDTVVRTR